jgi:FMN phosphatase YigB (HAD superfamily)
MEYPKSEHKCGKHKIRAVTFDFWETLYTDPADVEEKRKAARLSLLHQYITEKSRSITESELHSRYRETLQTLRQQSITTRRSVTLFDAVSLVLHNAGLTAAFSLSEIGQICNEMDRLCLVYPPLLIDNALQAIRRLSETYRIALISNTGETSGKILRELLLRDGLLSYFAHCSFSDEVGGFKPDALIFSHTLSCLGVEPSEAVHVGNEVASDVNGAIGAGLKAVLVNYSRTSYVASDDYEVVEDLLALSELLRNRI